MNLSACRACGGAAFDLHLMVPVGYCAECVASGQAAYDVADRAGDRVAANAATPSDAPTFADGTTIVYESSCVTITWNGSATFNVYSRGAFGVLAVEDCFTRYGVATVADAETAAYEWAWSE